MKETELKRVVINNKEYVIIEFTNLNNNNVVYDGIIHIFRKHKLLWLIPYYDSIKHFIIKSDKCVNIQRVNAIKWFNKHISHE